MCICSICIKESKSRAIIIIMTVTVQTNYNYIINNRIMINDKSPGSFVMHEQWMKLWTRLNDLIFSNWTSTYLKLSQNRSDKSETNLCSFLKNQHSTYRLEMIYSYSYILTVISQLFLTANVILSNNKYCS